MHFRRIDFGGRKTRVFFGLHYVAHTRIGNLAHHPFLCGWSSKIMVSMMQ